MRWWLYLDDLQIPKTEHDWVVVREYDAFVREVEARGFPEHVSFDHDLGEDTPSGMECARWLVERGIALGVDPHGLDWNVHSANVVGAANIRGLYASWCKHHASGA